MSADEKRLNALKKLKASVNDYFDSLDGMLIVDTSSGNEFYDLLDALSNVRGKIEKMLNVDSESMKFIDIDVSHSKCNSSNESRPAVDICVGLEQPLMKSPVRLWDEE